MDDLRIEGVELEDLVAKLSRTHDRLDTEDMLNNSVADWVGHAGLAHQLRTFTTAWQARRSHLVADLYWLLQATSTIESSFDNVEGELATSVTPTQSTSSGKAE